ncbi:MAG: transporter [Gemmatimonadales bacterium]|nr:transporter [Gemmatimonadales bacterium]
MGSTEEERDLGFGSIVSRQGGRLLNRDGTFNARRAGLGLEAFAPYHLALTMSWPAFLGGLTLWYVVLNAMFAGAYLLCGKGALIEHASGMASGTFLEAFFFSVQSFATIGYGDIIAVGSAANAVVAAESLVSILSVALATGIIFARFSRPRAQLRFSRRAIVAPYRGITALEFRIVNERRSEMVEVEAKVIFTYVDSTSGTAVRQYETLALERQRVVFFPLTWTVVHPIDADSPLRGATSEHLAAVKAEFLVIVSGTDEAVSQTVHARTSYRYDEVAWNARFTSAFLEPGRDGTIRVDVRRLSDLERV